MGLQNILNNREAFLVFSLKFCLRIDIRRNGVAESQNKEGEFEEATKKTDESLGGEED